MISREKVRHIWNTFLIICQAFDLLSLCIFALPVIVLTDTFDWLNDKPRTWAKDVSFTINFLNRLFPPAEH